MRSTIASRSASPLQASRPPSCTVRIGCCTGSLPAPTVASSPPHGSGDPGSAATLAAEAVESKFGAGQIPCRTWLIVALIAVVLSSQGVAGAGAALSSSPPEPCSAAMARQLGEASVLPEARGRNHNLRKIALWSFGGYLCRDLTGDGRAEMIVRMECCTGGSVTPWAIFMRSEIGIWDLAYLRAHDTVFRLSVRNRHVYALLPAPYGGACTEFVRDRVVRWNGWRFESRLSRRRPSGCKWPNYAGYRRCQDPRRAYLVVAVNGMGCTIATRVARAFWADPANPDPHKMRGFRCGRIHSGMYFGLVGSRVYCHRGTARLRADSRGE